MAKTRFVSLVAAAALASIAATPTIAAERQIRVEHGDLDLSTSAGQAKFKSRITRAVRNVCAFPSVKTAYERLDRDRCEARAKTSAMRQAGEKIARNGVQVKVALD